MLVGDIVKDINTIYICTYPWFDSCGFDLLCEDGNVIPDQILNNFELISSHNGSLKTGMAEFMNKYYKGE